MTCKICKSESYFWGCVDINKSCEEINNTIMPYKGQAIYYKKCTNCGFLFSNDFDQWDKDDFMRNIYNEDYIKVDPEYDGRRSQRDAHWFMQFCPEKRYSILDYGSGNRVFGNTLRQFGYDIDSWDPMDGTPKPDKQYQIMTCFEVLEHTPTPIETLAEMSSLLHPNGQIIFSTLVNEELKGKRDPMYWYLAPRNGHVCMHSFASLDLMFALFGFTVKHLNTSQHIAHKTS